MPTRFAGQPLKRLEDPRLLRGQATFLDDLRLSGARDVAFVRSIHPHARFRIDASAARAVAAGAALLHDGLQANIAADFTVRVGDADAAFRSADVTTRATYYVHRYTGMPLETRGVAAAWDAGTGQLTLWSSTQWPHTLRDALRDVLRLPEHRIRVVAPDVGGGFGVKQEIHPEEIVLARLAMLLHSPVKWVET